MGRWKEDNIIQMRRPDRSSDRQLLETPGSLAATFRVTYTCRFSSICGFWAPPALPRISVSLCIAVSISKPPSSGRPWFGLGRDILKTTLPTARYGQRASLNGIWAMIADHLIVSREYATRRTQANCNRRRVGAAKRDDADSFISSSCPSLATMHISGRLHGVLVSCNTSGRSGA